MDDASKPAITRAIIGFLTEIGFEIIPARITRQTFLPGIAVEGGKILVDESRLLYPGDLLHEAGHLAVIPAERRRLAGGSLGKIASEEMMAIAWSFAASVHLGLEPDVVFHEGGYRGGSQALIENFTKERYIGVPMLEWVGLTVDKKRAREIGMDPYPAMIKWMLE